MKRNEFTALGTVVFDSRKRIALKSPAYYQQCVDRLPAGEKVTVTVSTKKATRSEQQLRYYWVLLGYLSDHTGYEPEELHDYVMRAVFGTKLIVLNGKGVEIRKSISNAAMMPKWDAQRVIEYALELCGELGVHVPTLEELGFLPH